MTLAPCPPQGRLNSSLWREADTLALLSLQAFTTLHEVRKGDVAAAYLTAEKRVYTYTATLILFTALLVFVYVRPHRG